MISWRHLFSGAVALLLFVACLLAAPTNAHARKQGKALIDSLKAALPAIGEDTVRAATLTKIGYIYSTMDPDTGLAYAEKGLALAQKLDWNQYCGCLLLL